MKIACDEEIRILAGHFTRTDKSRKTSNHQDAQGKKNKKQNLGNFLPEI